MSRVNRKWGLDQGLPSLHLWFHPRRSVGYSFRCPQCDRWQEGQLATRTQTVPCECGFRVRVTINATLEELEEEEVKGE